MQNANLGNSNLEVSETGLGCMSMSGAYGSVMEKRDMISLIRSPGRSRGPYRRGGGSSKELN